MLIITDVFEEKTMLRLQDKKGDSNNAYNYCRFWRMLITTRVEERWGSSKMWMLARTCDKNEPPMDPDKDGVLSKVYFFGSHSNILRSAESRKWTALQFYYVNTRSSPRGQTAVPQAINKIHS